MRRAACWMSRAALALLAGTGSAGAQPGSAAAPEAAAPVALAPALSGVSLDGVPPADSLRTAQALGLRAGSRATAAAVRDGLRRVWALGLYDDLWAGLREGDARTVLVLHAAARPRIARIEVAGNRKVDSDKLVERTGLVAGTRLAGPQLAAAVDSVRRIYREKGYVRAEVTATTRAASPGQAVVGLEIVEGSPARVRAAEFPGAASFPPGVLRKQLASRFKSLLRSGKLDPEKQRRDLESVSGFYRDRGFRDVQVTGDSLRFSPDGRGITLVYRIGEGTRFHFGEVGWSGNQALSAAQAKAATRVRTGALYDASAIRKTVEEAYGQYAELGYLYVSVEPLEQPDDSGRVHVTFEAQEGRPSHLRRIQIAGNTHTKEKVVRRELVIHEGDLFRRSALIRTQQDVFRLGYFQDVQVDFKPADSTDVDLVLKVVEKETGTASAGAGYSSDGGLTGFVQLGHNNILGNGQAVSIQLERGARRSNVDVSFTDPYFRDSRTTLGASLFTRNRETQIVTTGSRLEYRDRRRGGSVRFGRPLFFVDRYTRGYVTYRLESVDLLESDGGAAGDPVQEALQSFLAGGPQTTSSVDLTLARDNTINPFYPKGGTRTTWSSEFAGGPLGGRVKFHKHEYDARVYVPSLLRPFTTMLRMRGGFIGAYGDPVPPYETFRLGGTTFYGVRGYEDYEIVPRDNVRTVYSTAIDTSATPDDTVRTGQEVRYPGGRWMQVFTLEQQFPIVDPVHGVLFFDAGATWNEWRDIRVLGDLHRSVGAGLRVEVPLLGNIGLDFGYGFDRRRAGWRTHFLLGNLLF